MRSLNRVQLLGYIGNAETRQTRGGVNCTSLSIATSYSVKNNHTQQWEERTDWHRVIVWRHDNLLPHLVKGTRILVEGALRTREYDGEHGRQFITEVNAQEIILLGKSNRETHKGDDFPQEAAPDDDVPF